ncbi:hypothetical protein JCM5350_004590 [Sporobolomyces pararoseus]
MSCAATSTPFSKLPPELVQYVLESAVTSYTLQPTPDNRDLNYRLRQWILCRLCLVSKKFLEIAQPLLFAHVHLREPRQHKRWKEGGGEAKAQLHRELLVEFYPYQLVKAGLNLNSLVRSSVGLRTLLIQGRDFPLDMSALNSLPSLATLHLSGVNMTMSSPLLSNAREITFCDSSTARPLSLSDILRPSSFPDLKILALEETYHQDEHEDVTMITSFGTQLDIIAFCLYENESGSSMDSIAMEIKEKTLLEENWLGQWSDHHFPYLRLNGFDRDFGFDNEGDPSFIVDQMVTKLSEFPPGGTPRLLYLPSSLHIHYNRMSEFGGPTIRGVCKQKKIEVVFERESRAAFKSPISDDFRRRMKEKKTAAAGGQ